MINHIPHRAASLIRLSLPPRLAGRFKAQIESWIESNGIEWTCNRLKAYNAGAIQLRAGRQDLATEVFREAGIAYSKKRIRGVFGFVVLNFLQSNNPQALRKWNALLRIYTLLVLERRDAKHTEKAINSICKTQTSEEQQYTDQCAEHLEEFVARSGLKVPKLQEPNLSRLNPYSATHREASAGSAEDACKAYAKHTSSLLSSVWIPPALVGENPAEPLRESLVDSGAECNTVGHISFLKEGGCKLRAIAVPNVWVQWLFEPLHTSLAQMIEQDHHSTVFDQNRGGYFLKDLLERNQKVYCFDLSSATDHFPLKLQQAVLKGLGLDTWADAIESVSKGNWKLDDTVVSYGTGQPMGLYGSFPLFHLTHSLLLQHLQEIAVAEGEVDCDFRVLGDDVIIHGKVLAGYYHFILTKMGVGISQTKSVTSESVGQFAGFTAIKTPYRTVLYRPYKWTATRVRNNVLQTCYGFGSKVKKYSGKWAQAYDTLATSWHLREPDLSPLVNLFDLPEPKPDWGLDSYLLGSLATRMSYELPYILTDEFHRLWFTQVYLLLGQKEILTDDPGLDLTSDPRSGGWTIQDRNQNFRATSALEKPEPKKTSEFDEILKDPVVRQSSQNRSTEQPAPKIFDIEKSSIFG